MKVSFYALVSAVITASVVLYITEKRYVKRSDFGASSAAITVESLRTNIGLYEGHSVSVLGVLKPLLEDGVPVNVVLVPNEDFLEFPVQHSSPYFVVLEGVGRAGSIGVKEECFGEFVSVTGTAGLFGGKASISEAPFIVRLSGSEDFNCLKL